LVLYMWSALFFLVARVVGGCMAGDFDLWIGHWMDGDSIDQTNQDSNRLCATTR